MEEVWIDADGKSHFISEMDTKYINNCVKSIKKLYGHVDEAWANRDSSHQILGPWWIFHYAEEYLMAFDQELEIRRRIEKKEYPAFSVIPSCEDCDRRIMCGEKCICKDWAFSPFNAHKYLDGINLKIARRGYYICNGMIYEV